MAAGLAGGSADAAAALVACNELWRTGLSQSELCAIGARLGSDVPFALVGGTAVGRGRGEQLTAALVAGTYHWALAFAAGGLSTPEVYAACDRLRAAGGGRVPPPELSGPLMTALRSSDPVAVGRHLTNDLQPAAMSLRPGPAPRAERRPGVRRGRRHGVGLGPDVHVPGPQRGPGPRDRRLADRRGQLPGGRGGQRAGARRRHRGGQGTGVNLVNLELAAKAYDERPLLDHLSLGVTAGDRIGVVGRNGAGKTTLLAALAGTAELDSGPVHPDRRHHHRLPGPVPAGHRPGARPGVRRAARA